MGAAGGWQRDAAVICFTSTMRIVPKSVEMEWNIKVWRQYEEKDIQKE